MEWQPIETAPKDGTKILIICADDDEPEIEVTEWCVLKQHHYEEVGEDLFKRVWDKPCEFWNGNGHRATHWMPLPNPPTVVPSPTDGQS